MMTQSSVRNFPLLALAATSLPMLCFGLNAELLTCSKCCSNKTMNEIVNCPEREQKCQEFSELGNSVIVPAKLPADQSLQTLTVSTTEPAATITY